MTQEQGTLTCGTCPHGCRLREGQRGVCLARGVQGGEIRLLNYGAVTSIALDPIEKKPLADFYPGSMILSIGGFGCNLACPFCQNHEIAQPAEGGDDMPGLPVRMIPPEELCALAEEFSAMPEGNLGVAYTYNEPLISWEYVRDAGRLIHGSGMKNVAVTNGCVTDTVLDEILPVIDAWNIDLKVFTEEGYRRLGGDLKTVMNTITRAAAVSHVEVTSLIVPGLNDSPADMEREAAWLAGIDPEMILHITRYFPRFRMREPATDIACMEQLRKTAQRYLKRVLLGNI
ncbi:MAG: AmmeMemoRadiSam system radical SAM enzyme [Lachnospiraceae bacterium]|nr:AmmeMemoRadiSam system radical SAM enzyme [Lachnospiraceae bacterium]